MMVNDTQGTWDIFISHASEDKKQIAEPLAKSLALFGINIWYDEYSLKIGDSLSRSIDEGLARSNFGLVILSPAFLAKRWPEYELRGLTSREMTGKKIILPIWHEIDFEQLVSFSPPLADKFALKTNDQTPTQLALKIIEVIRPELFTKIQRRLIHRLMSKRSAIRDIPVDDLQISPIRHPQFPPDLVSRIRLIRASLLPFFPQSMNDWVDGFARDAHPSSEIMFWEHVSAVCLEYCMLYAPRLKENAIKVSAQPAWDPAL